MYKLLSFTSSLLLATSLFAQLGDMPPNAEPGKCYAKCLIEVSIEAEDPHTEQASYTIYVGEKDVRTRTVYHPVRVDGFGNVKEQLPIEVPRKIRKIAQEDLQEVQYETFYEGREESSERAFTEWREIVCGGEISSRLVQQVADQLSNNGFQVNGVHEVMSSDVKAAMIEYQRVKGLPIGQLDFQTLESLGIDL